METKKPPVKDASASTKQDSPKYKKSGRSKFETVYRGHREILLVGKLEFLVVTYPSGSKYIVNRRTGSLERLNEKWYAKMHRMIDADTIDFNGNEEGIPEK